MAKHSELQYGYVPAPGSVAAHSLDRAMRDALLPRIRQSSAYGTYAPNLAATRGSQVTGPDIGMVPTNVARTDQERADFSAITLIIGSHEIDGLTDSDLSRIQNMIRRYRRTYARQLALPEHVRAHMPAWNCVDAPEGPHYLPGTDAGTDACVWCGKSRDVIGAEYGTE